MEFFSENRDAIRFDQFAEESEGGLRECQKGGFWAVRSHFTAYPEEPALVSMPTGSGKTALMMLLSFAVSEKQVLVITASDILRSQTAEKFRTLDGLQEAGVLSDGTISPSVKVIENRITDESEWEDIDDDVVVALPHNISSTYNMDQYDDIVDPPTGKFDLVFFDEAHRSRAPSWKRLVDAHRDANQVLLTATPFRRDRQTLPGRLVYHYPLSNAIEENLYQSLSLQTVPARGADYSADIFARRAKEALEDMRESFLEAKMLIRCERISDARGLEYIYASEDLDVRAIHSRRTPEQNARVLRALREGDIDGVIAVGMLGEGIDIPNLKIAVLHDPPKSFAFTLQLLGRVTRPTENEEVQAQIIADPDDLHDAGVEDEVKRLYHEDEGWEDLVPELAADYTEQHSPLATGNQSEVLRGVNEVDLEPYLSTRLFHVQESQFQPENIIELGDETISYRLQLSREDFVGVITEQTDRPTWGTRTPLQHRQYDLHLFYYHEATETLFESTSASASLIGTIRESLVDEDVESYGGESLIKVIQGDEAVEYQVAGLANALGSSGSLPSYKMLLGDRVEGAVRQTDAKAFTQGHAVASVDGETVGISNDQGRVWSSGRRTIEGFIEWCQGLAEKFSRFESQTTPPRLGLGEIIAVDSFPESPIFGTLNPKLRRQDVAIDTSSVLEAGGREEISELTLESLHRPSSDSIVEFEYAPVDGEEVLTGEYDIAANQVRGDIAECVYFIDSEEGEQKYLGERFFDRFPLYFYTGDGTLVSNGRGHRIRHELATVPDDCFVDGSSIDWSECATWCEFGITKDGESVTPERRIDIFGWVEEFVEQHGEAEQIVFCDHTQGEIADYIQIEPSSKQITFYHCKSRDKDEDSGARLADVREVVDQVHRSISWVKYSGLPGQIEYREGNTEYPHFVSGQASFGDFKESFLPMEWDFTVSIVQPGLDYEDARSSDNVNTALLTCKEWLEGVDAEFNIFGDPNGQIESIDTS